MKKIGLLLSLFIILSAFTCENEPLDVDGFNIDNNPIENPGGESTGDYWPMAVGNNWLYENIVDGVNQEDYDMTISDLVNYQGNDSYKYITFLPSVQATDGTGFENVSLDFYTRKNNGDYYVTVGDLEANLMGLFEITQTGYSFIILKDYLDVGATWTQNVQTETTFSSSQPGVPDLPPTVMNLELNFEILGKDLTMTVNEVEYTSIIKVKYNMNTEIPDAPSETTSSESIYYFAKDIGLIKSESTIVDDADSVTSTSGTELISYSLN